LTKLYLYAYITERMTRNSITQAIILKIYRIGEIHKGVILLTKNLGIINAIAHGAWKIKSRLRAYTQLFNYIKVYLYYNPVKQTYKITDIECLYSCVAVTQSIEKYYCISICVEVVLKSFGGGESVNEIFSLLLDVLKILDKIRDDETDFILIQFLWRFLYLTGHRLNPKNCHSCGKSFSDSLHIYYLKGMTGFICPNCRKGNAVQLYPGMIKYLEKTEYIPLNKALCFKLEKKSIVLLRKVVINLVETYIETPLQSIKSGAGIIDPV